MVSQDYHILAQFTPASLDRPRPRLYGHSLARYLFELAFMVIAIYTLVNLLSVRFLVDGVSMSPSFESGQSLFVNRLDYLFGTPQYGDIVVFHNPSNTAEDYIKRIIGLPGDVIEIRDTILYRNGVPIIETYVAEPCTPHSCPDNRWELGDNEYFVLGDNRNHSSDSRLFGPIHHSLLVGKVVFRYWPLSDIGIINR